MEKLLDILRQFRDERDWKKFHTPKDLAISVSIEAGELLELFQWTPEHLDPDPAVTTAVSKEAADVLIYTLLLFDRLGLDPVTEVMKKMDFNRERFPVDKTFGKPGSKMGDR